MMKGDEEEKLITLPFLWENFSLVLSLSALNIIIMVNIYVNNNKVSSLSFKAFKDMHTARR